MGNLNLFHPIITDTQQQQMMMRNINKSIKGRVK